MNCQGTYRIERVDQLLALRSPTRFQMVAAMRILGECSIREIAEQMNRSPDSLHYHIRKMESLELVEQVGKRRVSCRMEAIYRLPGADFKIDLVDRTPEFRAAVRQVYGAGFRFADRCMGKALLSESNLDTSKPEIPRLIQLSVRMRKTAMQEVCRRVEELRAFVAENEDSRAGERYLLTIAHHQQVDQRRGDR